MTVISKRRLTLIFQILAVSLANTILIVRQSNLFGGFCPIAIDIAIHFSITLYQAGSIYQNSPTFFPRPSS